MNDQQHSTQFDCMKVSAEVVLHPPHDDVVFLLSMFEHLEQLCENETDQLEALAENIIERTEIAESSLVEKKVCEEAWPTAKRPLSTCERAKIANRYKVPYHIFGTARASRGAKDLEFLQLEATEHKIQNYMRQMAELEAEIAAAIPSTPKGIMLKLRFVSSLCKEGSSFAADVLPHVVDQSVDELSRMLEICLSDFAP